MAQEFSENELSTIFTWFEDTSDELSQSEVEIWRMLAIKSIKNARANTDKDNSM